VEYLNQTPSRCARTALVQSAGTLTSRLSQAGHGPQVCPGEHRKNDLSCIPMRFIFQ